MKIICIFGTRPEAIKLAPVIRELQRRSVSDNIQTIICVTGQHRQMLDQVLSLFNIQPDIDLDVMAENQTPSQVAATVISQLEPILTKENPDWVIVQGDTTTVAAASIAAYYARIKVGHVEAGLRTFDKWQPFPEEINRKIAGSIADLHFAPTQRALQNLIHEGIPREKIVVTGNPVIDALHWVADQPPTAEVHELFKNFGFHHWVNEPRSDTALRSPWQEDQRRAILVTAHRRENFGEPIIEICNALREIANRYPQNIRIIYPVHLNPNIWKPVHRLLEDIPNIILTSPLEYLPLVHLMKRSYLVLTDSGGIQEEAPGLGKPVLVLREVTERPEAVEAGTVKLVGTDSRKIISEVTRLLEDQDTYMSMAQATNPYGDGHSAQRIIQALLGEIVDEYRHIRGKKS